jgi:hypothetical protein
MDDFKEVPMRLPQRPEGEDNDLAHHLEWIDACKGGPPPSSSFPERSGPFTEMVLLGNVALRAGGKVRVGRESASSQERRGVRRQDPLHISHVVKPWSFGRVFWAF